MRAIARMESFVWYIVTGGIGLVGGLWLIEIATVRTLPWVLGLLLAALGVVGLAAGIGTEIE